MGRPRKFDNARARDKVAAAIRDSRSANYTDGFLDGAREGYAAGYDVGYEDGTAGRPRRTPERDRGRR